MELTLTLFALYASFVAASWSNWDEFGEELKEIQYTTEAVTEENDRFDYIILSLNSDTESFRPFIPTPSAPPMDDKRKREDEPQGQNKRRRYDSALLGFDTLANMPYGTARSSDTAGLFGMTGSVMPSTSATSNIPWDSTNTYNIPRGSASTDNIAWESTPTSAIPWRSKPTDTLPWGSTPTTTTTRGSTPTTTTTWSSMSTGTAVIRPLVIKRTERRTKAKADVDHDKTRATGWVSEEEWLRNKRAEEEKIVKQAEIIRRNRLAEQHSRILEQEKERYLAEHQKRSEAKQRRLASIQRKLERTDACHVDTFEGHSNTEKRDSPL